jgi:peptide-methionine (S)-S-oxide reductase
MFVGVSVADSKTIVLGGGCFWCLEAVFDGFKGVSSAVSGYSGGSAEDASYEKVGTGKTGHAEVIEVKYDPAVISLPVILEIFFHAHNPTTKDRQGNDVGPQYRSSIFYNDPNELSVVQAAVKEVSSAKLWGDDLIVTEIKPLDKFYSAEAYHQEYFLNNPSAPYCSLVIAPKVRKIYTKYRDRIKSQP